MSQEAGNGLTESFALGFLTGYNQHVSESILIKTQVGKDSVSKVGKFRSVEWCTVSQILSGYGSKASHSSFPYRPVQHDSLFHQVYKPKKQWKGKASEMHIEVFYNLIIEVTSHCSCYILFIRSKLLGSDPTQKMVLHVSMTTGKWRLLGALGIVNLTLCGKIRVFEQVI